MEGGMVDKGAWRNFMGGHGHYLDCGCNFMGVFIYHILSNMIYAIYFMPIIQK